MFTTAVTPRISPNKIELKDHILALGSCFAQNIGQKLRDYKFHVKANPFGTLFNPISIFKLVNKSVQKETMDPMGIVENQGVYHHYDLHSDLSKLDRGELLENANRLVRQIGTELPHTSLIIYTFGTAIVYELKESGEIVTNCHKIPSNRFSRRFLDVDEIVNAFGVDYDLIKSINKDVRFILTVSPVRHQKESFEQNNVSKSILRIACEKIVHQYTEAEYFPAFEIMMDELRDYRFYAEDMLHPSAVATEHIWKKFQDTYFDDEHKQFVRKWEKVRKAMAHKPLNKGGEQHKLFIEKTICLLKEFKMDIDVNLELEFLKAQLT